MALVIYPTLEQLKDCLCFALSETSSGEVCSCCVIHSSTAPTSANSTFAEACKCGIAWVRLSEMSPRPSQPTKKQLDGSSCMPGGGLMALVELGVLRCVPKPTSTANMCPCLEGHAQVADEDLAAMLKAVECCLPTATVRRVLPAGKDDCAGTTVLIEFPMNICLDCDSPGDSPSDSPGESP